MVLMANLGIMESIDVCQLSSKLRGQWCLNVNPSTNGLQLLVIPFRWKQIYIDQSKDDFLMSNLLCLIQRPRMLMNLWMK